MGLRGGGGMRTLSKRKNYENVETGAQFPVLDNSSAEK